MEIIAKIILLLVISLNILLSIFVLTQNPKVLSTRIFSILSFMGAMWTYTHYMVNATSSVFWFLCTFVLGSIVIATGLIWTIVITKKGIPRILIFLILSLSLLFSVASLMPGFILRLPFNSTLINSSTDVYGWGLYLFSVYYLIFGFLIIFKLYKAQKISSDKMERSQFKFILIGALISLTASGLTTFVIPLYAVSLSGIIDSTGFLIFLLFVAYSITKHRLFNIRVIAIEVVMFLLWLTLIFQAFRAEIHENLVISIVILVTTVIFGILLIRSTLNEIKQQEQIDKLSNELKKAYADRIENSAHTKITDSTVNER